MWMTDWPNRATCPASSQTVVPPGQAGTKSGFDSRISTKFQATFRARKWYGEHGADQVPSSFHQTDFSGTTTL